MMPKVTLIIMLLSSLKHHESGQEHETDEEVVCEVQQNRKRDEDA